MAGTVLSAAGTLASARAQSKSAKYNAEVARQQAEQERKLAAAEEQDFREEQSRLHARQRAVAAGTGRVLTTGTPLLSNEHLYREVEYEAAKIKAGGAAKATRLENQATLYGMKGKSAKTAGYFKAGSTLLSGARTAYKELD